jgi:hypothetical protein
VQAPLRRWLLAGGTFVATGLAGFWALPLAKQNVVHRRSHHPNLPTIDMPMTCPGVAELEAVSGALARRGVPVDVIGYSRSGRPIRLISMDYGGTLDALVVGTPHPNEPIGGRTIQVMLDLLLRQSPALAGLPFNWHFIPTIEPDGLAMNAGWLATPHDLRAYVHGFYRPAFRHQAEYSFPLQTQRYRFDVSTPETLAWMSAIDRLRPALMVSLHNADHGGAFNVLNRAEPGLAVELSGQARSHGIALDVAGDPLVEQQALSPGVFLADDFSALVDHAPAGVWTAGDSSFGYAARHGTLGLAPEVPMWQEAEVDGQRSSADAWAGLREFYAATCDLVDRALHLVGGGTESDLLLAAVAEGGAVLRRLIEAQARQPNRALPTTQVNMQRRRLRMLPLRTLSMLNRWCRETTAGCNDAVLCRMLAELKRQATGLVESQWGDRSLTVGMVPVPVRAAVATQLQAILSAASAVASAPPASRTPVAGTS